jgi:hypothetical protein
MTGSNMWNSHGTFNMLTPFDDDNVIYSVHFYEPLLFTHQNAPWVNNPEIKVARTYPCDYGLAMSAGLWDRQRFVKEFEPVNEFRKKYNAQVICNEFGVYTPVELQAQLRWYDDLLFSPQGNGNRLFVLELQKPRLWNNFRRGETA